MLRFPILIYFVIFKVHPTVKYDEDISNRLWLFLMFHPDKPTHKPINHQTNILAKMQIWYNKINFNVTMHSPEPL